MTEESGVWLLVAYAPVGVLGLRRSRRFVWFWNTFQSEVMEEVNLVAIAILSRGRCGLSRCITFYLVAMATTDIAALVTDVILHRINNMYFPVSFLLLTPVCALRHALYIVSVDCSVWFTVAFTFDRLVAICCRNLKRKFCCLRTTAVIIFAVFGASILKSFPVYFAYKPVIVIGSLPWYCRGKAEFWASPYWKLYQRGGTFVTFLLPILLISLFNALTVRYIIAANRVRRRLRSNGGNDHEMENRRKSIGLLFAVSANVVLLWVPKAIHALNWQLQNYNYGNKYLNTPVYNHQQIGHMLQFLSFSTNTCIYGITQKKFREELGNGIKCFLKLNRKIIPE
ncbi:probable G-protein coupled receptor 139 [Hemitrygon akajei]|uniref:probable G-protein coupled receptor 139 n=1 Tax=Hemitrygon akajei TaxID=2704970 RepID=UPI003BF989CC